MDIPENIVTQSDRILENLRHLATIHPKWEEELKNTDWSHRPQGFENQKAAVELQESAFAWESRRYLDTRVNEWAATLNFSSIAEMERFRDSLKTVAKYFSDKLKKSAETPAAQDPSLGF